MDDRYQENQFRAKQSAFSVQKPRCLTPGLAKSGKLLPMAR
jgi:hypothetical protein